MNNQDVENIRLAKTSHIKWFSYIELFEQGIFSFKDRIAIVKTDSDFGKWYYGEGQKFAHIPSFKTLDDFNSIVHEQFAHILKHVNTPVKKKSFLQGGGDDSAERKETLVKLISGLRSTSQKFTNAIESFEKYVVNKIESEKKQALDSKIAQERKAELQQEETIKREDAKLDSELSSVKLESFLTQQRETQNQMSKVAQRITESKLEIERRKNETPTKITESRIEQEAKRMEIAGKKKKMEDTIPAPPISIEEEIKSFKLKPTKVSNPILEESIISEKEKEEKAKDDLRERIKLMEAKILAAKEKEALRLKKEEIIQSTKLDNPKESKTIKNNANDIDFDEEMRKMMQ